MNCPNCNRKVEGKKNQIINCLCGKKLMIIEINKVKEVVDITPNKGEK